MIDDDEMAVLKKLKNSRDQKTLLLNHKNKTLFEMIKSLENKGLLTMAKKNDFWFLEITIEGMVVLRFLE